MMYLSDWHKERAERNKEIEPFTVKEKRLFALGERTDFEDDKMQTFMTINAEKIFEPKKIISGGDWLCSQREGFQSYSYYKAGNGNIKWIKPNKNKINLFIMDNTFKEDDLKKYVEYATAFFPGAQVGIIKKTDFLTKAKVANREGMLGQ